MEIPSQELVAAVKQAMEDLKPKKLSKNKLHQQIEDGEYSHRLNKKLVLKFLDGDKLVPTNTSETMRLWLSQQSHVPVPATSKVERVQLRSRLKMPASSFSLELTLPLCTSRRYMLCNHIHVQSARAQHELTISDLSVCIVIVKTL
jgi:hypothetical protein